MEDLIQIASSISKANPVFRKNHFSDSVYARLYVLEDENPELCWLTNASMNSRLPKDMQELGKFVSKNSIFAVRVLNGSVGDEVTYSLLGCNPRREINHSVDILNKTDLFRKIILIAGEKAGYEYDDIDFFLSELCLKEKDIRENEKKRKELERLREDTMDSHRKGEITKEINKLNEKYYSLTLQQEELANLTKFIRKQGKLRFNPILDPIQNRIKTQNLFDGKMLIIDGGPGTGKTTTMIQRLKYLTDVEAIKEDTEQEIGNYKLNVTQRNALFDSIENNKDWIFFSPSKLLKDYLADAMNREGLTDTKNKVWNWDEYRKKLVREYYDFVDPMEPDRSPFKFYKGQEALFDIDSDIINDFMEYYTNQLKSIVNKLPNINVTDSSYKWYSLAKRIQLDIGQSKEYSVIQFIVLFHSLYTSHYADCKLLLAENKYLVKKTTTEILALVNVDVHAKTEIQQLTNMNEVDTEDEISDEESLNDVIYDMLFRWLKQYCLHTVLKNKKLSERNENISKIVIPLLLESQKDSMKRISELVLFEQFAKYTTGVKNNMLRGIPSLYKRFRQQAKNNKAHSWNQELLANLISSKMIHPQEQSLLIGIINNLVKDIIRNAPSSDMTHRYIDAYREVTRPIIGIDEATDFSKYDIYAMESLLNIDYNSLTLCGDVMQRLTVHGIRNWDDLGGVLKDSHIVQMNKSYRQSSRLLDVAKSLYVDSVGKEPKYTAYMNSKKVPAPLAYVSDNEGNKILWIEKRIKDVYNAYGKKLPSIAIFLNSEEDISPFMKQLKETDFIEDSGIDVVNGNSVAADQNQIRIYPINVVKGMEFDVVFFHNIDKANTDEDMIKRYIYVGVSRAAFFLGITLNEPNQNILKYFSQTEKWG